MSVEISARGWQMNDNELEQEQLLKIYFAFAHFYFYRNDIVPVKEGEDWKVFIENNREVVEKVCAEALFHFGCELSQSQIGQAAQVYIRPARSLADSPPTPKPISEWILFGCGGWIETRNWGWSDS